MMSRLILMLVSLSLLSAGGAFAGSITGASDVARGQKLAQRLCANCHLVDANQTKAMADVPSFREIANKQDQTAGAIMAQIIIPKHPMPVIPISKGELKDLAAYILSLRDPASE